MTKVPETSIRQTPISRCKTVPVADVLQITAKTVFHSASGKADPTGAHEMYSVSSCDWPRTPPGLRGG